LANIRSSAHNELKSGIAPRPKSAHKRTLSKERMGGAPRFSAEVAFPVSPAHLPWADCGERHAK
jgi:hypothetical protein